MIGDLFPSEKCARAAGVFMVGLPFGLGPAFMLVGGIVQTYGWQVPFLIAALPGFAVAFVMVWVKEPIRDAQETYPVASKAEGFRRPCVKVLSIPTV
jgi:MFS family permease